MTLSDRTMTRIHTYFVASVGDMHRAGALTTEGRDWLLHRLMDGPAALADLMDRRIVGLVS
jgi:hypothetical protein